jgi:hypothetical protein
MKKISWRFSALRFARFMLNVVLIVLVMLIAAYILIKAVVFFVPTPVIDEIEYQARHTLGVDTGPLPLGGLPKQSAELQSASRDHEIVSNWVLFCLKTNRPDELPASLQESLGSYELEPVAGYIEHSSFLSVNPKYLRVAGLSRLILMKRVAVDRNLSTAYNIAKVGAFSAIFIGLLTTVFVALSSTDFGKQQNFIGTGIRVGALALPAIGTAVAALIAFYDPNGNLARASQVASGLQQLHTQITLATWKELTCSKDAAEKPTAAETNLMDSWSQRYQELVAGMVDTRAKSVEQSSGGNRANSPNQGARIQEQ